MHDILNEITSQGLNRDGARAARRSKQEGKKAQVGGVKTAPYRYLFEPKDGEYVLELRFKRAEVETAQVVRALKSALDSIEAETSTGAPDNF
jgi:hypothetical protein